MNPRQRKSSSFVDRHNLWTRAQAKAADEVERIIKKEKLELVRFSFADQHGVLRGKTLLASEAASAMRAGNNDSNAASQETPRTAQFIRCSRPAALAMSEMQGGGDFLMVADPSAFRVLPWANKTGWMLCDSLFQQGKASSVFFARVAGMP
jgi:glutamine synthetase